MTLNAELQKLKKLGPSGLSAAWSIEASVESEIETGLRPSAAEEKWAVKAAQSVARIKASQTVAHKTTWN